MSFSPTFIAQMQERPIEKPDQTRFEIPKKDRDKLITAKINHRKELRDYYGNNWRRHLNVPAKSLGKPVRFSY